MAHVDVEFTELRQGTARMGSGDDDHMVSIAVCRIVVDGQDRGVHEVRIKQPAGGSFDDPIEVEAPTTYDGPIDIQAFGDLVDGYYRHLIGPTGIVIRVGPGTSNLTMQGNSFQIPSAGAFETTDPS
jgi:hypothetical protein